MSNSDSDQPPKDAPETGHRPDRASQLFGHKGGGKPWEAPREGETPARKQTAAPSSPYPDAPSYAPRTAAPQTPAEEADVDEAELTLLHPNSKLLMRISAIIAALVLFLASDDSRMCTAGAYPVTAGSM